MNERFQELHNQARDFYLQDDYMDLSMKDLHRLVESKFAELIVEETLKQVDERVYGRSENQWYYEVDKNWIRLHFGYGELSK